MKVKALVSFTGQFTMAEGETADITNEVVLQDLLKCGYVKDIDEDKATIKDKVEKPKKVKKS